jgi:ACT domain-containing protein
MKTNKEKDALLEQLKKTPIIQIACEKIGLSRTTYYRWYQADLKFAKAADTAIFDGCLLINDMAESQLISAIRDKNFSAIVYWLKHHHPTYANRLEITAQLKQSEELTPEQATIVREALRRSSLLIDQKTAGNQEYEK